MSAVDYVPQNRLAIAGGATLRLDDGEGMVLFVWQGSVWLTQEYDSRDHLLKAGEWFRLDRPGTALVSPLGDGALVSVTPPEKSLDKGGSMKKTIQAFGFAALAGCSSVLPVSETQVPDRLKPAADEHMKRIISAKGVQIYECRSGKWVFVAPEAELFDSRGNLIGKHYAGPHWEATGDGSKVVGTVKARYDAPEAGAIPWLLLDTKSVGGRGYFADVTSIQRVATHGGMAPGDGCPHDGLQARVYYTADYYFFHREAR